MLHPTLKKFILRDCVRCPGATYPLAQFLRDFRNETNADFRRGAVVMQLASAGYAIGFTGRQDAIVGLAPKGQWLIEADGAMELERA